MQASSGLFYDVFRKYDPANGLLKQAEREVLEDELDVRRLQETLQKMSARQARNPKLSNARRHSRFH